METGVWERVFGSVVLDLLALGHSPLDWGIWRCELLKHLCSEVTLRLVSKLEFTARQQYLALL